jgi:hypothetical protein
MGRYRFEKKDYNNNVDQYARVWADKLFHYCNYQTYAELSKAIKTNHLCQTTRFTSYYYSRKLKEIFGKKARLIYPYRSSSKIKFHFLKYVSGITIVLYKGEYSGY